MACGASPTASGILISDYGLRPGRTNPEVTQWHAGWDFRAPRGSKIYAPYAGVVESVYPNVIGHWEGPPMRQGSRFVGGGPLSGYGNAVVVRHDELGPLWSLAAHLDYPLVDEGQELRGGELLGISGSTTNGKFRGMVAHLHDEWRVPRPDGSSPFPGPYRRFGIDPAIAFRYLGLELRPVTGGLRQLTPVGACRAAELALAVRAGTAGDLAGYDCWSPSGPVVEMEGYQPGPYTRRLLCRLEMATGRRWNLGEEPAPAPDDDYEPPPEWFRKAKPWLGLGLAAGMLAGAAKLGQTWGRR